MKVVIIGAGIAGLQTARYLKIPYEIYDERSLPGGHASSHIKDGFIFDEGIHVMHSRDKKILADFHKLLKGRYLVHRHRVKILTHGVYIKYPFQANTFGLPIEIVKDCLLGFIKVKYAKNLPRPKNYQEWLEYTYGPGIAKHLLLPYTKKMWLTEPATLSLEWLNERFPRPSLEEVIEGALHENPKEFGPNAEFRYPLKGGFGAWPKALASLVNSINFQQRATQILPQQQIVIFNNQKKVKYDKLVLTIPLPELPKLIKPLPQSVKNAIKKLKYLSDFAINLGIDRPDVSNLHWLYFADKKYPFFRISFPHNFSKYNCPPGTSMIQAEISYSTWRPIDKRKAVKKTVRSLKELGFIKPSDKIILQQTIDMKYAYMIFDFNRKKSVRLIHKYLEKHNIFPAGRFAQWDYLWTHDAFISGQQTARLINNCFC